MQAALDADQNLKSIKKYYRSRYSRKTKSTSQFLLEPAANVTASSVSPPTFTSDKRTKVKPTIWQLFIMIIIKNNIVEKCTTSPARAKTKGIESAAKLPECDAEVSCDKNTTQIHPNMLVNAYSRSKTDHTAATADELSGCVSSRSMATDTLMTCYELMIIEPKGGILSGSH